MATAKRTVQKPRKPLKVKKTALRDLPLKEEATRVKGGLAPPYVPVGPGGSKY